MAALDIGIFANNEAARIGPMVADLANKDLIREPRANIGVLILANGCTDDTVIRARAAITALHDPPVRDRTAVRDLPGQVAHGAALHPGSIARPGGCSGTSWTVISTCPVSTRWRAC